MWIRSIFFASKGAHRRDVFRTIKPLFLVNDIERALEDFFNGSFEVEGLR